MAWRPITFDSIDEALADTAATYRKALWREADHYVEIWLEKDALSGVILPVTKKFDVPLMVARGIKWREHLREARKPGPGAPENALRHFNESLWPGLSPRKKGEALLRAPKQNAKAAG